MGLAVGAKFSAIMLLIPLVLSLTWNRSAAVSVRGGSFRSVVAQGGRWLRRPVAEIALAVGAALTVFAVTNPFALLDNTCYSTWPGITLPLINVTVGPFTNHSCYLQNIATQSSMVRGNPGIPFTLQYVGTPAYVYFVDQMARWGLGLPLALVAFGGLLWSVWRFGSRKSSCPGGEGVLLAWVLPFFLVTGGFQVKFLRYLLPLTPFLIVMGAGMLAAAGQHPGQAENQVAGEPRRPGVVRAGIIVVVVALTSLWAVAFVNLYRVQEHPWIAASRWIRENVPGNSVVATEHWDHTLPIGLRPDEGAPPPQRLQSVVLQWYSVEDRWRSEEMRESLTTAAEQVAGSDYLILASNRLYGVIPRLPDRYPEAAAYYRLLMGGELGFELVYWNSRYPNLSSLALTNEPFTRPGLPVPTPIAAWQPAPITWTLGPADESLTVYDHPLVLIFENQERLTAAEIEALILAEADSHHACVGE
jgi:hypothetical protein